MNMRTKQEITDQIQVMEAKKKIFVDRHNELLYKKVNPVGNVQMMECALQRKFFDHTIKVLKWILGEEVEF